MRVPVNSRSFFMTTQIGEPMHRSTSSRGRIVLAIVIVDVVFVTVELSTWMLTRGHKPVEVEWTTWIID